MKTIAEYLRQIQRHVFSEEGLEKTFELLKTFDFTLLKSLDQQTRKEALFCLFLLIGRPRLSPIATGTFKTGTLHVLGQKKPTIFLPFIQRGARVYLVMGSNTEEESLFQVQASQAIKPVSLMMTSHLFVYCSSPRITATVAAVDLSLLRADANFEGIISRLPDPLKVKAFAPFSPHWNSLANFEFLWIGGGEEELPSCSSSNSKSRVASGDKLRELVSQENKSLATMAKASFLYLRHKQTPKGGLIDKRAEANKQTSKETLENRKEFLNSIKPSVVPEPMKLPTAFKIRISNPTTLSGNTLSINTRIPSEIKPTGKILIKSSKKKDDFIISNFALKKSKTHEEPKEKKREKILIKVAKRPPAEIEEISDSNRGLLTDRVHHRVPTRQPSQLCFNFKRQQPSIVVK